MKVDIVKAYLSSSAVSEMTGLSLAALAHRRFVDNDQLRFVMVDGKPRYLLNDVERYLAEQADLPNEVWKVIPGFPNYEMSSLRRVRRATASQGTHVGRLLKIRQRGGGLGVSLTEGAKVRQRSVEKLWQEVFGQKS